MKNEPRDSGMDHVRSVRRPKLSGDFIEEAIPDPIPNSEVKLFGADGTAWGIYVGE